MYSDELYHHGIKGMKWGVRRYQNEDGSLTAKGQKHRHSTLKGAGHRAAAKVFEINEKTYNKLGNKTMASANRAAKERQLKKAEESDKNGGVGYAVKKKWNGLSDKQKKALKIAGVAAGAAALGYGAYKLSQHNYNKRYKEYNNAWERDKKDAHQKSYNDDLAYMKRLNTRNSPIKEHTTNDFSRSDEALRKAESTMYARIQRRKQHSGRGTGESAPYAHVRTTRTIRGVNGNDKEYMDSKTYAYKEKKMNYGESARINKDERRRQRQEQMRMRRRSVGAN